MISSLGVGSGLDLQSLVTQLVNAERQPALGRLNFKEASFQAELSAFGSLKAVASRVDESLESLRNVTSRMTARVVNGDNILSATADEAAVPGAYTVRSQQLASSQGLASIALTDSDTAVGAGILIIDRGTTDYDVDTDTYNGFTSNGTDALELEFTDPATSLADIRDAINAADAGINAVIVTDDSGARLALSTDDTGADNTIRIQVEEPVGGLLDPPPTNDNLEGLSILAFNEIATNLGQTIEAKDALATVNGLQVTSSDNSFENAIQGLSFELLSADENDVTIVVENDVGSIATGVREFIEAYNEFAGFAADSASYNPETQEAGILFGDSTMRSLRSILRRAVSADNGDGNPALRSLLDVGLDFDAGGLLELDQEKLNALVEEDLDAVVGFLTGVAASLQTSVSGYTQDDGLISARTEGLQARIEDIGDQRGALDRRTEALQTRFTAQFAALDGLLAGLQSTSSFLSQQLVNLNVNNSNR